jgi:WD40 repeat protein
MPTDRPVVFLASANAEGDLPELREESRQLQELFEAFQGEGRCTLVFRPNATLEQIFAVLSAQRDRIALFHFGGHADSARLMLDSALGRAPAHGHGLASLLGQQRGLQLAFLNGCSTRPQVQRLLEAGVPGVIATSRAINDRTAREFAVAFYTALTKGGDDIQGGQSLLGAFEAAKGFVAAREGGQPRGLVTRELGVEDVADPHGFPWDLTIRPGAETVGRWDLFADDPLFGLPPLPADIVPPARPFRHLERFARDHARVFFGRGRAIRNLFDLVRNPATASVILYYGPTGVGKSSVLDAGLLPRLEEGYQVRYLRRSPDLGLLGTLRRDLAPESDAASFDLGHRWLELEQSDLQHKPLVVILDQAEEAFTRPLTGPTPGGNGVAIPPPGLDPNDEVRALVGALRATFADPSQPARPRGMMILGFRKEWLQEFEQAFDAAKLPFEPMPLDPLDPDGVVEAIEGPARDPALRRYGLEVQDGLARIIADDLTADADARSVIAPTLQVLLSKLWDRARRQSDRPAFDIRLYDGLRKEGVLLRDFLEQQLRRLEEEYAEVVNSGLALDLLEAHTTTWGTAQRQSRAGLLERYPQQHAAALVRLLDRCKDLYLLVDPPPDPSDVIPRTSLAHDTLAPLVRERFLSSPAPAQRARRLLENRAAEWKDGTIGTVLDRADLETVETGLPAMRRPTVEETRLIEASRQAEAQRRALQEEQEHRLRQAEDHRRQAEADKQQETELRLSQQETANRRLRRRAYVLAGSFTAALGLAIWAGFAQRAERIQAGIAKTSAAEAEKQAGFARTNAAAAKKQAGIADEQRRHAESRQLAAQAISQFQNNRLDLGLLLSLQAYDPAYTFDARNALLSGLQTEPHLISFLSHTSSVQSVAFTPDGRFLAAASGTAIALWDTSSHERVGEFVSHTDAIFDMAFSPDGTMLASGSRFTNRLMLWDVKSRRPIGQALDVQDGAIQSLAFSPDGRTLASGAGDHTIVLWAVATRKPIVTFRRHGSNVTSLDFSPDGRLLASGSWDGKAIIWNVEGQAPLHILADHPGQVETVAFHPNGKLLATGSGTMVRLWDVASGEPRGRPMQHQGKVNSLAFGAGGQLLASAGSDSTSIVLWKVTSQEMVERLTGHTSWLHCVEFASKESTKLASSSADGTAILWDVGADSRLGRALDANEGAITSMAVSHDGTTVAVATVGNPSGKEAMQAVIRLLSLKEPGEASRRIGGIKGAVAAMAFSEDDSRLTACRRQGGNNLDGTGLELYQWVLDAQLSGGLVAETTAHGIRTEMAFTPDSKVLVAAIGSELGLFETVTCKALDERLTGHKASIILGIAFSPDGRILAASGLNDSKVILWDLATRLPLYGPLSGQRVVFAPGGGTLVTIHQPAPDRFATIQLWDVATGRNLRSTRTPHQGIIVAFAISRDGRTAALADYEGHIYLWDLDADQPLGKVLSGHTKAIRRLAIALDDRVLLSADDSGKLLLWDLDDRSWRRRACAIANRNLTFAEWEQYEGERPYQITCPTRPPHPSLLEAGRALARSGEVEKATSMIRRAVQLDGTLRVDPEKEATRLGAEGYLESGRNLATFGSVDRAITLFRRAKELDPTLDLDPAVEAGKRAAPGYVEKGHRLALEGDVGGAVKSFQRAQTLDATVQISAYYWSVLCWSGCLNGRAVDVMHAGQQAVDRQSDNANFYDVRGLAKALTGDREGAIQDFESFLARAGKRPGFHGRPGSIQERSWEVYMARVAGWISSLRAGKTPFTPEEMNYLRKTKFRGR